MASSPSSLKSSAELTCLRVLLILDTNIDQQSYSSFNLKPASGELVPDPALRLVEGLCKHCLERLSLAIRVSTISPFLLHFVAGPWLVPLNIYLCHLSP